MEATTATARAAGAAKLAVATVGLAAPPLLLATVIGNPLPTLPVDWARVVESIQAGLVPSEVWLNVLAVVAWAAWAALTMVLTVEVVAVVRHRPSAAAVSGWVRHLAQALVAAAIALAGPGQQPLAAATAGASFVAAAAPVAPSVQPAPVEDEPAVDGRMVTVGEGEGDSWGGFAADVLGDATLGPQLREANLGRKLDDGHTVTANTAFVEPGWGLLIPAALDATGDAAPSPARLAEGEGVASWEVEPGDHFWSIAEQTLGDAWGRTPTDAEIAPYWQQVIDENRDRLLPPGDPDLIYPEQDFAIPAPPADPTAPEPSPDTPLADGWRQAVEGATVEPTSLQHRPPGLRLPTPLPDAQDEEAKLAAAAAPDPVLDDLAAMLGTIPADTHPVLVTVGDDGEITLLFDEQDELPEPPAPWTLAHDGASGPVGWQTTLGSRGLDRSFGLPLLVTLGRTGTAAVLANVAVMGTLVIAGDEVQVRRCQRTMSLEVATSRVSVPVEVAVTGDERMTTQSGSDGWLVDLEDARTGRLHLPGGGTVTLALPDIDPDVVDNELTRLVQPATGPVVEEAPEPAPPGEPSTNGHRPPAHTSRGRCGPHATHDRRAGGGAHASPAGGAYLPRDARRGPARSESMPRCGPATTLPPGRSECCRR